MSDERPERVKDPLAALGEELRATVTVQPPAEARREANAFGVELPPLERGCIYCAPGQSKREGLGERPGELYLKLGHGTINPFEKGDQGPTERAPPAFAPVCKGCLIDMEFEEGSA